ncbi:hypothetical protein DFH27DRAFT_526717 [Peziza echinospora]|nr:hypothetical protein DFH27DRAFT_526717 [Peziza echinospora]
MPNVHLDVSLGNALWLNDLLVHAYLARDGLSFPHNILQEAGTGPEGIDAVVGDVAGTQPLDELGLGLHNMVLDGIEEEDERPAPSRSGIFKSGPKPVAFSQGERLEIRNYLQMVHDLNEVPIQVAVAVVPQSGLRYARFQLGADGSGDLLGSIRSQRHSPTNRNSSWVCFQEPVPHGHVQETPMQYGQVDYYVKVEIQEVLYELARVHVHPAEDLDPTFPTRLVKMKSEYQLRQEAARQRGRPGMPAEKRKWRWISIECIKGLVGRLTTQEETYFISKYGSGIFNPAVVFMEPNELLNLEASQV